MPPVDRYRTRGHSHGRGAPGAARRLGHDPRRHCGAPPPRSASGHTAAPPLAAGPPAPARRWGAPLRLCLTLSRVGASCSPPARDINFTTMEVLPMSTAQIETPYQVITDRILALLAQGTVPWQQPWDSVTGLPRNPFSQRAYRGINVWLLTTMGYASPFWATFPQVKAAGGSVRKGEHGVPVVFWKVSDHEDSETGAWEKRFVLRQYTVFNAVQLDGVAVPEITILAHRFTPIERCAHLVDDTIGRATV